ncbi:Glycosyl transferases group 1 [Formosa sp. Hel1_31_208]|uniref:glycosyltransferase n=1 Tax=Formosa sp. Hel1_31_208 TaxID=1798225 RepID=UPI00087BAF4F|nr:glycosyltransferase [Formosa sp. Hel1_31_208]SDS03233.1 Glycosyl transferases group 1 [Formosa sp. Hel1_31_208]
MKILLVGEYNQSHKYLKEGLIKLGHEALVVGLTDGFKKIDVDIEIKNRYTQGISKKWRWLLLKVFKIDLYSLDVKKQILNLQSHLSGYDIVQFINESSFICRPKIEREIFDLLVDWNGKAFLLSCGTDYTSVKYAFEKKFKYSILTPYFEGRLPEHNYSLGLKYLKPEFKALHEHIFKRISGVISSDLDYYMPLKDHDKHLGLIPHPINTDVITYQPLQIEDKIVILHGINRNNYYKKGNDVFEKALAVIHKIYADKIDIITVESLPYKAYIKTFEKAHILLDQVFSYDQGYNALEAMAKGKVVFTGAEQEWLDYYQLKEDTVAINALPDPNLIVKKLEWLILHPEVLQNISTNARAFVEQEHHYVTCAEESLKVWKNAKSS